MATRKLSIYLDENVSDHAEILAWIESLQTEGSSYRSRAVSYYIIKALHKYVKNQTRKSGQISRNGASTKPVKERDIQLPRESRRPAQTDIVPNPKNEEPQLYDNSAWKEAPKDAPKASPRLHNLMKSISFE